MDSVAQTPTSLCAAINAFRSQDHTSNINELRLTPSLIILTSETLPSRASRLRALWPKKRRLLF